MITTKNLSKRYGDNLAVDDLTFSVAPGEVLGFLGANGAGKSTTMRMIAGFISPSAGQVSVCGFDIEKSPVAAKSCMGYLPEGAPSYGEMTVAEFLDFVSDVRGLAGSNPKFALPSSSTTGGAYIPSDKHIQGVQATLGLSLYFGKLSEKAPPG